MTQMLGLVLDHNYIRDITPLSGMTNLLWLSLTQNEVNNLSAITGMTQLNTLILHYNRITDLQPLVDNPGIGPNHTTVDVSLGNPLTNPNVPAEKAELYAAGVNLE
jgi:Leucine-rich repeat (LRR) protein